VIETLRIPFFVLALVLLAFAVSFEIGLGLVRPALVPPPGGQLPDVSPGFAVPYLAAITDARAALITSVLALVWIAVLFIGNLPGLVRAIRSLLTARPAT